MLFRSRLAQRSAGAPRTRGQETRRILLDAIELLNPGDNVGLRALERSLALTEADGPTLEGMQRLLADEAEQPLQLIAARSDASPANARNCRANQSRSCR